MIRSVFCYAIVIVFSVETCPFLVWAEEKPNPRTDFAAAMSRIRVGMTAAQAKDLVGAPDEIRQIPRSTMPDGFGPPDDIPHRGYVWRYGVADDTPTLGRLEIGNDGRVSGIIGNGKPISDRTIREEELRRVITALAHVPSYESVDEYNPRHVIRAVNILHSMGKNRALAAVEEFLRVTTAVEPGWYGTILVLRVLFDVPDAEMPRVGVGGFDSILPLNESTGGKFPIVIVNDIPFLVAGNRGPVAAPLVVVEQPREHIEYFRKLGVLREKPLVPPSLPFRSFNAFAGSADWFYVKAGQELETEGSAVLIDQLMRLIDSVYWVAPALLKDSGSRAALIQCAMNIRLHWDSSALAYRVQEPSRRR